MRAAAALIDFRQGLLEDALAVDKACAVVVRIFVAGDADAALGRRAVNHLSLIHISSGRGCYSI